MAILSGLLGSLLSSPPLGTLLSSPPLGSLLSSPPSARSLAACSAIAARTSFTLTYYTGRTSTAYYTATNHYWSETNSEAVPACVVFPESAQDVSAAIRILLQYPDVPFAVKSGGHNPNTGFSSTNGGVLISFQNLRSTTLSPDNKTAAVGPGSQWVDAIGALEPHGLAVVGGRLGDVGVGGLLLGCGLSFLSAQYGLPCDNIVNYEVVLANASVVNANHTSNPDLFWALKGGGDQFGIVTKYTLKTYPIGMIWGGVRTYSAVYARQILNAAQAFTENYQDPRASLFVTGEIVLRGLDQFFAVFLFYNGARPPPGVFDDFLDIPYTGDHLRTQSYSSLLKANQDFGSIYGFRYLLRGTTIPNLPGQDGADLVNANWNNVVSYVEKRASLASLLQLDFIWILIYQPVPMAIANASTAINPAGNLLGLSADAGDHMWMAVTVAWETSLGDSDAHATAAEMINNIAAYPQQIYPGSQPSNYNFDAGYVAPLGYDLIFMNDAMADQPVLQSYGDATYQRLKDIQKAYDKMGVFPQRTNGFKLS